MTEMTETSWYDQTNWLFSRFNFFFFFFFFFFFVFIALNGLSFYNFLWYNLLSFPYIFTDTYLRKECYTRSDATDVASDIGLHSIPLIYIFKTQQQIAKMDMVTFEDYNNGCEK